RAVLLLPDREHAADHTRAEPCARLLSKERRQRFLEVPRRQTAQIQDRQHLGQFRAPPHVGRQDLARKALPLALDHSPVIDPGSLDLHRPASQRDPPGPRPSVPHHQRVARFVSLAPVSLQVGGHFRLERRLEHATGPLPGELVQREPSLPRLQRRGVDGYLEHGGRLLPPAASGVFASGFTRKDTPPLFFPSSHAIHNFREYLTILESSSPPTYRSPTGHRGSDEAPPETRVLNLGTGDELATLPDLNR